jgi:NAD(P)-dependent dehydrogenase (short-subunit alcohol dehydrogenase family)
MHARNRQRAAQALAAAPGAEGVVTGDLCIIAETIQVAEQVNKMGVFDAVIHNAGIGYREPKRIQTPDGLSHVFAVNSLAPYILTCLINPPQRLIYMSSGLHHSGDATLDDLAWVQKPWKGMNAYADSKLHIALLAFAIARLWPGVCSNAVEPGWVATKMGGAAAPDNLEEGPVTQAWLAAGQDSDTWVTGKYFYHQRTLEPHPAVSDEKIQNRLLKECERWSGISFPAHKARFNPQ